VHIVAAVTLDTTVAFDTVVVFVIFLVAMLMPWPILWCKEHRWNFSVLQRVHLLRLVKSTVMKKII
jgi:hypothetical protein